MFLVDLKPAKPIIRRICAVSGSESMSLSWSIGSGLVLPLVVVVVVDAADFVVVPFDLAAAEAGVPDLEEGGFGALPRGPDGGALLWFCGLRERVRRSRWPRGGVRVRVLGPVVSRRGDRERDRRRSSPRAVSFVKSVS